MSTGIKIIAKASLVRHLAINGISPSELSKLIGVSKSTVYNILNAKPIKPSTASKLLKILKVSFNDVLQII